MSQSLTSVSNSEQLIPDQKLARVQVSNQKLTDLQNKIPDMEGQSEFNIWFSKWTGKKINPLRDPSQFRCNIIKDSGITLGSSDPSSSFCVFFAKGRCPNGHKCRFWHRLPNDNDKEEITKDCFGRDRFGEFKDDLGGVGSFSRNCRTLQVSRFALSEKDDEEMIRRHFAEWGPIIQLKVIPTENIAFVKYKKRIYAEFAKEAMSSQSLDRREVLNVRWASKEDDMENKEEQKKLAKEMVLNAMKDRLPQEYIQTSAGPHYYKEINDKEEHQNKADNEKILENGKGKTLSSSILSDSVIESLSKKRTREKENESTNKISSLKLLNDDYQSSEDSSQDE